VQVCVCVCVEDMCVPDDAFVSEVSCIHHTSECWRGAICHIFKNSVIQSIFLEDMRVLNNAFISDDIFEKYCVSICLSDTMS